MRASERLGVFCFCVCVCMRAREIENVESACVCVCVRVRACVRVVCVRAAPADGRLLSATQRDLIPYISDTLYQ